MANPDHLARLIAGVEEWNSWRRRNRGISPDLSDPDWREADLRDADLHGANLHGTNLSGAVLNKSGADLIGANLRKANLRDNSKLTSQIRCNGVVPFR
jgi:uncharacterized protein YjbI with pentapeptide repeats